MFKESERDLLNNDVSSESNEYSRIRANSSCQDVSLGSDHRTLFLS